MEVILLERIEKLGQMGDVVTVKAGYARNYLLPKKKAVPATAESKAHFETQRAQLEAENLEHKSEAEAVAAKMDGVLVMMVRQAGDAGQLYGSVSARDVAAGLTEAGFTVARQQVSLDQPIKAIGLHPVTVTLHPEVSVTVTANVARSEEEAAIQERTGEAVLGAEEEEAQAAEAEAAEAEIEAAADENPEENPETEQFFDPPSETGAEEGGDEEAAAEEDKADEAE